MSPYKTMLRTYSINCLFASFFLSIIGWGLLHTGVRGFGASVFPQALLAVPGFVLGGLSLYRYKHHWPNRLANNAAPKMQKEKESQYYRAIGSIFFLAGIGFSLALTVAGGYLFPTFLVTVGLAFIPWTKISMCRNHFFATSVSIPVFFALGMVVFGRSLHPLYCIAAASHLLAISSAALLHVIIMNGNKLERMPAWEHSQESSSFSKSGAGPDGSGVDDRHVSQP